MNNDPIDMGGFLLTSDAPLAGRNTLRVDARARLLAEVHDVGKLPGLLAYPAVRDGKVLVLGEGSNMLIRGDIDATVVAIANRGVETFQRDDRVLIRVAAGERWDDFVRWSLGQGYAGLENLILIPGTVGASPIQNIGAYGVEVAEFIDTVEAWDTHKGEFVLLDKAACAFSYRDSAFKRQPRRWIVVAVTFDLPRERPLSLDYAGIREEMEKMGAQRATPYHVAEAVVRLRSRKLPDPAVIGNAGSFFKNPIVGAHQADALALAHPGLPVWPHAGGTAKLSAGWLIETAGFKGARDGDAGMSNRHALVLVNHGKASGPQLWSFAQKVIAGVEAMFGVTLEPEPLVI
ncbi:UDP-N-acetylmuramate dehydrogenase [Luteibacter sp. 22Crub2.1]|uniref:UDP-N-acetylmuramate dehydrogenase n=1 Tax=Luteibacter sp. 22Crub2.1 TaxID=1283288 RepID=UPI0009C4A770|nr:UDP-N-acetylmuramate dehydrogenase [Luteibacter sp. 22Crub2.1]SKB82370.1 UDP-N-acetylmuramate dehydrogenase [Luteibacter sp. 22Crub2.1]